MRRAALLIFLSLATVLSACSPAYDPVDSMFGKRAATAARLDLAASDALAAGNTEEALALYEKLNKKHPGDVDVAVNYARLLRKNGRAQKALDVLAPFASKERKDAAPTALNEYGANNIELGKFAAAEETLNRVLANKDWTDFHADAQNLLGVSLDAQGRHKEAETLLRQALDGWQGDPTSVMNNLGLCLASQGMFDESLNTLRKALVMAPAKQEIARNIQIVENLRASVVPAAPVSLKK